MRVKFLLVISSFLILSVSIVSCLDNDEHEYSTDDTIREFAIDEIYGKGIDFTIDQVNLRIFNIDSVPYSADTIINKILITKFTTATASDHFITGDTLFHYKTDSLDLSATMETPLKVKVYAPDGENFKEYAIEVRIHRQDPDSLVWGKTPYTESFSGGAIAGQTSKTVILNGKVLVYASDGTTVLMYEGPVQNSPWAAVATLLPANANISSMLNYGEVLYVTTPSGDVLSSADGIKWNAVTSNAKVETLLTVFNSNHTDTAQQIESIAAIIRTDTRYFSLGTLANGALTWEKGEIVPSDFPTENISATRSFKTDTGIQKAFLTGKPDAGASNTATWFSLDGMDWAAVTDKDKPEDKFLPLMERPTILYYGKTFYVFGDDFSAIYKSEDGMFWNATTEKFLYPSDSDGASLFKGRGTDYSIVVDNSNYIWMVWHKGASYSDEVWRAKLNRLGFIIQD